jgi:hypothetical protein
MYVNSGNYTILKDSGFAYKFHRDELDEYIKLVLTCLSEDALLFYPSSKTEQEAVFAMINDTKVDHIFIGIQKYKSDQYKTVDGLLYHNFVQSISFNKIIILRRLNQLLFQLGSRGT